MVTTAMSAISAAQRHHHRHRHKKCPDYYDSFFLPLQLQLQMLLLLLFLSLPKQTHGFAAWFVDRRVSCFTPLVADEIVMNAGILPHSQSREPLIHIEVSPLGNTDHTAQPDSKYSVEFILPRDENGNVNYHISDIQYVLELVGENPVAKFTSAPTNGGIGCDGRRSFGAVRAKDETTVGSSTKTNAAAIFTINHDATIGSSLEIVAGWATGHTAVTLTEKVTLFVGQGIAPHNGNGGDDDALQDDETEVELEEAYIEEEREEFERVIEDVEEDAVAALEEKRRELGAHVPTKSDGNENEDVITEAEEEIVEVMETNRHHVNEALDSLKDAIASEYADRLLNPNRNQHHQHHEEMQRREAQRDHRARHELKFKNKEGRLEEMRRHFDNHKLNMDNIPKDKLNVLMNMKESMKESFKKLHLMDGKEHDRARREHIPQIPKEELKLDVDKLKRKAQEKIHLLSDKIVGVNEMMNGSPRIKEIRNKLKQGQMRGGEGIYHGDVGTPLPPEGRHFLMIMFLLLGFVGLIRWYVEKRRQSRMNKGRRNL